MYFYERVMEIGVGRYANGHCFFTCNHKAFEEKYGERLNDIPPAQLYSKMEELATWANNDVEIGCFFYMF